MMTNDRSSRVLVVDDDPNQQQLLTWELEEDGHEVDVAGDGREALRKIRVWVPDVVVLDVAMEGLDGAETLARIRSLTPFGPGLPSRPKVIIHTGFAACREQQHVWRADDFVLKSSDMSRLRRAVARLVGSGKDSVCA